MNLWRTLMSWELMRAVFISSRRYVRRAPEMVARRANAAQ